MYGSVSLRKYTGPNQVLPLRASMKRGSFEKSMPLFTVFMATREIFNCSRPWPSR